MQRADLESLIDRVARLAQEAPTTAAFYEQLADELSLGLGCHAVIIWQVLDETRAEPFVRRPATDEVATPRSIGGACVVARSGSSFNGKVDGEENARLIRAIVPVRLDDRVPVVVEATRSLEVRPALDGTQLGGLLEVIAELAAAVERRMSLADVGQRLSWHAELEAFVLAIHGSLDPLTTAHEIANEGRRVIGCDRLSLLERRGRSYRVVAVSGQHEVHRRSNTVRALEKLVAATMTVQRQLSHPLNGRDLPPQLDSAVDAYCDQSGATRIEITSLADSSREMIQPTGALIAENFAGASDSDAMRERTGKVAEHATQAWLRAGEHRTVFLLPLWAAIGKLWPRGTMALVGWLVAAVAMIGVTIALLTIQTDFEVVAEGTLEPAVRSHLFATSDGVIAELSAEQGMEVARGQTLVTIENPDLELRMEESAGELQTTSKKLASVKIARLSEESSQQVDAARLNQLAAEEAELEVWLASLQRQRSLLEQQHEQLTLTSPIDGTVITWNVEEQLEGRPVREGQRLMTIANLNGAWILELDLPAARAGHVAMAAGDSEQPLPVSFVLATDPEQTYSGTLLRMSDTTDVNDQAEPIVRMVIALDARAIGDRRPGAVATAKIDCGRRSLGDVWFRDLIEFVQRKILFRFS